jgi:hypothetical protein
MRDLDAHAKPSDPDRAIRAWRQRLRRDPEGHAATRSPIVVIPRPATRRRLLDDRRLFLLGGTFFGAGSGAGSAAGGVTSTQVSPCLTWPCGHRTGGVTIVGGFGANSSWIGGHSTLNSQAVPLVLPSQFGSTSTLTLASPAAGKSIVPEPPTHCVSWMSWPPPLSFIRSLMMKFSQENLAVP